MEAPWYLAAAAAAAAGHALHHRSLSKRLASTYLTGFGPATSPEAAAAALAAASQHPAMPPGSSSSSRLGRVAATSTSASRIRTVYNMFVVFVKLLIGFMEMAWEGLGLKEVPLGLGFVVGYVILVQLLMLWKVVSLQGRIVELLEAQQQWQQQRIIASVAPIGGL